MLRKRFRRSNSTDNYQAVANMPLKLEEVTILKKQEIWDIFAKLVEALNLYHQKGIVYGNLKMLQIWITGAFHVTLDESQPVPIEFHKSDQKQWVIGMKDFFAPELMTYEGDIIKKLWRQTMQSDMFALGCVIYKLIGSIHPFNNGKRNTVWLPFIITKEPDQLPEDYSNQLKDIVMSLLRKAPKQRPSIQDILGQPQIAESVQGWKQMKAIEMESIRMQSFKFKGQMNECTIIPYKDKDLIQRELFEIKADGTINESSSLNSQYQIARQMHKEFRLPGICRHGLDKSTVLCFVQIYYKEKKEDSEEFRKKFKEQLKEFGQKSAFYVRSGGSRENGQDHAVQYDFYLFMTQQEKYSTKTKKEREEFKDSIQPLIKSCSGELINFVGMKLTEYVRNVVYNCDLVKNETRQKACNLDYQFPVFGKDVRKIIQKRKKVGKKLNFVIRKEEDDLEGNMKKDIEKGQDLPNMVKKKRKRDDEVNENKDLELNEQENKDIELNEQDNREEEDKELDVKEDMNQDEQKEVSEEEEEENQDKELKEKKVVCSKCKLDITEGDHGQCCWCKLWFHFHCLHFKKSRANKLLLWWCNTCKSTEFHKQFKSIICATIKRPILREQKFSELFESRKEEEQQNIMKLKDQEDVNMLVVEKNYLEMNEHNNNEENKDRKLNVLKGQEGATIEQKNQKENIEDMNMQNGDKNKELEVKKDMNQDGKKEEEIKQQEENQDKDLKEKKVVCNKCEIDITAYDHGQCYWCKLWTHYKCSKDHKSYAKKQLHWWCITCKSTEYNKKYKKIINTTLQQPLQREKQLSELFESRNQDKGESKLKIKDQQQNNSMETDKDIELKKQDNIEEENKELDLKENQIKNKKVKENKEEEENQDKDLKKKKVVCSQCEIDITEGDHGQCCWCKQWFHFYCQDIWKVSAQILLHWWCNTCRGTEYHKQYKSIISTTQLKPLLREKQLSGLFQSSQKDQKEEVQEDENKELEVKEDMNQDGKKEEEIKQEEENQDKDLKEKKVVCSKCEIDITAHDHGQCYWCKLWFHFRCQKDFKYFANKQLHWWCITCKSTEFNKKYKKIIEKTKIKPLLRDKQLSELFESRKKDQEQNSMIIKEKEENNNEEQNKQEEEYEVDEEINKENEKKEEENKQQEYEMMEVENKQSNVF
ncbi:MAG: hypothetical protein EZS28_013350 [Streblomastix strix]|uniref:Protein kinase domain-containing protein n=1 Tax=Streblomastix strix TaxID=222440 RepID=A0A5J4W911_9EUKA|nr:MAG: hypothetical protein EZS28_013350 [Streblomastix strix]